LFEDTETYIDKVNKMQRNTYLSTYLRWLRILPACLFSIFLVGCGETTSVKKEVLANLKDPDSAKFGEITIKKTGKTNANFGDILGACVTVNSKNSMGGYGGDEQAILIKGEKWEFSGMTKITHQDCLKMVSN